MSLTRDALRREAKKLYKEQAKKIQRKNRMPFSRFFKRYVESKKIKGDMEPKDPETEDFDFEDLININDISDDDKESDMKKIT